MDFTIRSVDRSSALIWWQEGWSKFKTSPLFWVGLAWGLAAVNFALNFFLKVAGLGNAILPAILASILPISLYCGAIKVISMEDANGVKDYSQIFEIIAKRPLGFLRMLLIGLPGLLLLIAVETAVALLVVPFISGIVESIPALVFTIVLFILFVPLIATFVTALAVFAQIFVVYDQANFALLAKCVQGCVRNALPIAIFYLTLFALFIPVGLTLGLGLIVLSPVFILAHYMLCKNLIETHTAGIMLSSDVSQMS